MRIADVMLVARKELRETLRDRRTLAVMVLFPLVVYPLVSLATVQVLATRIDRNEKEPARIAVSGPPALADRVHAHLAARNRNGKEDFVFRAAPATAADVRARVVDAAIQVERPAAPAGVASVRVLYDETDERSRSARARVEEALATGPEAGCVASYTVTVEGVAPKAAMGGYLLSKILPLIIIVMVMLGAFHPAIDITAGERERGTLETTLSAPIGRAALMTGKVVAVATLATMSGVLNLASMSITVLQGAKLASAGAPISLPWANAGAAALLVIPPAAFLFSSVMVAIGSLARSFKEAQTLLTPVYFLCMAPSLLAALGDFELGGVAAFVPGVGVTLLARDVIAGHASVAATAAVFGSSVGYGAAALALACRLYDSERLLGADDAGLPLRAWLRHVIFGPRSARARDAETPPTAGQALALYAFAWLILLAFIPVQQWRLGPGLALFEWVGLLGLTAVYARGSGRSLAAVLRFRKPSASAALGALLVGSCAWLVIGPLVSWLLPPPPKEMEDLLKRAILPGEGKGAFVLALFLTALSPAVCEEALFRGPILRGLRTRFPAFGSAVLTGLLFGLFHADFWRLLPTAVLGFGLSAIALAADSIIPAMIAHFANNACIIILASSSTETVMPDAKHKLALIALGILGVSAGGTLLVRASGQRDRNP